MPTDAKGRSRVMQWLMFQMGGVGPMMGQANVFFRYFPEKIQPAIDRYQNECRRLFEVLERAARRERSGWPATTRSPTSPTGRGSRTHKWSGISIDGLDHLQRWMAKCRPVRPARGVSRCRSRCPILPTRPKTRRAKNSPKAHRRSCSARSHSPDDGDSSHRPNRMRGDCPL